jgi:hypothetical protein
MGVLNDHFTRIRASLLAKAEEAGILRHSTSKGSARELIISDFLESSLPREFDFVTGEITSPTGRRSGQLDIMLLPQSAPRFRLAPGVSLGLLHAVAAVIEVKSVLSTAPLCNPSELRNAIETVRSVRVLEINPRLDPWPWSAARAATYEPVQLDHIPVCIVAFKGPTIETLLGYLSEFAVANRADLPNVITCLERDYTLILNDGWIFNPASLSEDSRQKLYLKGDCSSLVDLFDFLMKVTQAWAFASPRTPFSRYL